jgi:hypothetical protein
LGNKRKTNPFAVARDMVLARVVQVDSIQTADGEGENHLYEAEHGVQDVVEGHLAATDEPHLDEMLFPLCFWVVMVVGAR